MNPRTAADDTVAISQDSTEGALNRFLAALGFAGISSDLKTGSAIVTDTQVTPSLSDGPGANVTIPPSSSGTAQTTHPTYTPQEWESAKQTQDVCELERGKHRVWVLNGVDHDLKLDANVDALFIKEKHPEEHQKHAVLILGGAGTGKSTILAKAKTHDTLLSKNNTIYINTDDIMVQQPGYKALMNLSMSDGLPITDQQAAHKYHDAAKKMAAKMYDEVLAGGYDLIFDGTGKNTRKLKARVDRLRDEGYTIAVYHTVLPADEALKRAMPRADKRGRYVPPDVITESNPGNRSAIENRLIKEVGLDESEFEILDNL